MASPYSTGGGGPHFEARVAAIYLSAALCDAPARGLPGSVVEVRSQRANDGEPLDDLIAEGVLPNGRATKLSLQIKTTLAFTKSDAEWRAVVEAAWDTFVATTFDSSFHRIGVAVATYNAKIDSYYQSVLTWARNSAAGADFLRRIETKDFAHAEKRSFVESVQSIITDHAGQPPTDDELWRFLRSFVILHFDLNLDEGSSRDEAAAIDRLRDLLQGSQARSADAVWSFLVAHAGRLIPAGGSASRETLSSALEIAGLPNGAPVSRRADLDAINRESQLALSQIKSDIAGLSLFRAAAYQRLRGALSEARFVQIDGEPGAGKSALLKLLAEECAQSGPIFVLKDRRIHPRGWTAHAHVLGVSPDAGVILREFACSGEPILFIDGIDKIDDPGEQLTVNDLINTIAKSETLRRWRIVVTVRAQNLRHLETWLNAETVRALGLATVTVESFTRTELGVIAAAHTRLAPLMQQSESLDVILSRPFFINALLSLISRSPAAAVPATEVDLLRLWWSLGGADDEDPVRAQHRRNALMQLARLLAASPSGALAIAALPPEPLAELRSAGVLRDKDVGHSVIFTHDIYEEWTLCEFLRGVRQRLPEELLAVGEPQAFVRPIQLLGTYLLETETTTDEWEALLASASRSDLRPIWQTAALTAPLQSTQGPLLLGKLASFLQADEAAKLKRLLLAIRTIEVIPNPLYLNERTLPNVEPAERVKLAEYAAIPKVTPWARLFAWLIPLLPSLSPELIPALLPVLRTWQDAFAVKNIRYCSEIGAEAHRWLQEFEEASYTDTWDQRRKPFGIEFPYREEEKLESAIRQLFLSAAGDVPNLARDYLRSLSADDRRRHHVRDEVLANAAQLMRALPTELVDFILSSFLEFPEEDDDDPFGSSHMRLRDDLGVTGHESFYPASPINPPFLGLLRFHEAEGLRLVKAICNHSVAVWRWQRPQAFHYNPATPIPVIVRFPWGKQTLWGDHQVYLWARAIWGNDASKSAFLALEQWALEKLDAGADFADIFRKCVEGHEGVGALCIGASLCLAFPNKAVDSALPLITSPYVWQWDIARTVQDQRGLRSSEMGDWYRHKARLQAVRDLNDRPHRGHDIRSLVPYFAISPAALRRRYTRAIRAFPKHLPFEFEEMKNVPELVHQLTERAKFWVEQGDPKFWKMRPAADGEHVEIYNDAPSSAAPEQVARQEELALLNKVSGLAMWAQKTLDSGEIDPRYTLQTALSTAQELDRSDLLEERYEPSELTLLNSASAVAGTAYVIAAFIAEQEWTPEVAHWCADVLHRAATIVEPTDGFGYRGAITLMHPSVFAAHGYAALLSRGYEPDVAQEALLNLAVDPLEDVLKAVFASAKRYAAIYPQFARVILVLGLKQCVCSEDELPNHNSSVWDDAEAEQKLGLLAWADDHLGTGKTPAMPPVPMHWVRDSRGRVRHGRPVEWTRNERLFRFDLAEKILFEIDLAWVLSDAELRASFLALVANLVDWTIQQLVPPFDKEDRRQYGGNQPFQWIFAFSAWCGKLCAQLSADEVRATVLKRVYATENDAALKIMQSFMRLFMVYALVRPENIRPDSLTLWSEVTSWIFDNPAWRHGRDRDHLDREFQSCALHVMFCFHNDFGPVMCAVSEGWPHLSLFQPILERGVREFGLNDALYFVILKFFTGGGFDLLPEPGLPWLKHLVDDKKSDLGFWESNGTETVALLRQLIEKKAVALRSTHRAIIHAIADILVDNGVRGAGFLQQELLREAS